MRGSWAGRLSVYLAGLVVLALGITLNVKTGLGVSPLVSVAHVAALVIPAPIGDTTFVLYSSFVVVQIVMHLLMYRRNRTLPIGSIIVKDMLQLPLSMAFTRLMNVFEAAIPMMTDLVQGSFFASMAGRLLVLLAAIVCTGVGAAASLDMRLIPNPGDGIVQTIADVSHLETGLVKNIFDGCSVALALVLSYAILHENLTIGIGTLAAFLGIGRVMALFNKTREKKVNNPFGIDFGDIAKMKKEFDRMKSAMDDISATGNAGGDMVSITIDGNDNVRDVKISDEAYALGAGTLQTLVSAALGDALRRLNEAKMDKQKELAMDLLANR